MKQSLDNADERIFTPPWGPSNNIFREHIARYAFVKPHLKGCDVLDVACGTGYGSHALSRLAKSVIGLDISSASIQFANQHYHSPNLKYIVGDALALPFPDQCFDAVVSFETIEHLSDQNAFLKEIRRVLKNNGTLFMSTPDREVIPLFMINPSEYKNPFHVRELSKKEFADLLSKYFTITLWYGQGRYLGQPNRDNKPVLSSIKKFFRWVPERIRLKLISWIVRTGPADVIFELGDNKSKYLIAHCQKYVK